MKSLQTLLTEVCSQMEGVNVRSYSGRCMYGRECLGLTGTHGDCMTVLSETIKMASQEVFDAAADAVSDDEMRGANEANSDLHSMLDEVMKYLQDSMGRDVILYWPDVAWEEVDEAEESNAD